MDKTGWSAVAVCGVALVFAVFPGLAWPQAEPPVPDPAAPVVLDASSASSQPSLDALEGQLKDAKSKVSVLSEESESATRELRSVQSSLNGAEQRLFALSAIQNILQPTRYFSPLLANLGFFCAAIALLYIVVTRSRTARALLSLKFPFSVSIRRPASNAAPMGERARLFWGIVFVLILLLLALPALAQEPQEAAPEPVPGPEGVIAPPPPPPVEAPPALPSQMETATKYIELTPLERAILILEGAPAAGAFDLSLEQDVIQAIRAAASAHNHPPMIESQTTTEPEILNLKKDTPGYYIVLASLYEAAGRPNACETFAKGIQPFTADSESLKSSMPYKSLNAVLLWLADCNTTDLAKYFIPAVAETAPGIEGVRGAVGVAEKLGLTEEVRKSIEVNVGRVTKLESVEGLAELAQEKGFKDLAQQVIETNLPKFELDGQLRLIRQLHKLVEATKIEGLLDSASSVADVEEVLLIAETAADLGLDATAGAMLQKAFQRARDGADADKILAMAVKLTSPTKDILHPLLRTLQDSLPTKSAMADWLVEAQPPSAFGAAILDQEKASLACIVAVTLFTPESQAALRPLFEQPVMRQLDAVVKSIGAQPQMRINDLYLLARYYELTKDSALEVTKRMIALQQQLRGLDKAAASEADAKRLAMMMELEQLRSQAAQLEKSLAETKAETRSVQNRLTEVRVKTAVQLSEGLAKSLLIVLGWWIALSRAIAAARGARNWVFSHFCWKFLETVGFECCCAVVMLPIGVPLTLISQDRLKHLALMEMPGESVKSPAQAAEAVRDSDKPDANGA